MKLTSILAKPAHAYDDVPVPVDSEVRARAKTITGRPIDPEGLLERAAKAANISKRQLGPSTRGRDGDPLSMTLGFKWLDRAHPGSLPRLDHIMGMPPRLIAAVCHELMSEPRAAVDLMRGALDAAGEVADIAGAVLEAKADGVVTAAELDRIEREALQAVDKCRRVAVLAAVLRAAMKEEQGR